MNKSHYAVIGVEPGAGQEAVEAAFQELLVVRRSRRSKTSDLHAAHAVLSDANLRRAYDLALFGTATAEKLTRAKDATVDMVDHVRESMSEVDLQAVAHDAWQTTLKAVVLVSGVAAKFADVTGTMSRKLQGEAAKRIAV